MNLKKTVRREQLAYIGPSGARGGDKRTQHYHACLVHEFCHFSDAAHVFFAIGGTKAEVGTHTVPDIVTVEHVGLAAHIEQLPFDRMRRGRFAGAGQAGEPDHRCLMAVRSLTLPEIHQGGVPDQIIFR
jgi:hypothetical protein